MAFNLSYSPLAIPLIITVGILALLARALNNVAYSTQTPFLIFKIDLIGSNLPI